MKKKRVITLLTATLLAGSLVACGTSTTETMAPVAEESATVDPTTTEEATKEVAVDPDVTFVEIHNLKYTDDLAVVTNGILYVGNDIETLEVIDVNFEITNVVVEDVEDNKRMVTVEQSIGGYIWTDGNIFKTNLNVPIARLANSYDGQMIAVGDEDAVETELKWKDNTYTVSAFETSSWDDDDWSTGWYPDPSGDGERLNSTLNVKTVVTIDNEYDGLILVLTPLDEHGSVDSGFIMNDWTNDSHLFNINDMNAIFVAKAEAVKETETDESEVAESAEEEVKAESKTDEAKSAETTATTAPKEEHKHNYTSTDSSSSCTVAGIRTYTCSGCGASYTENLGYGLHDYSIPVYSTVHHDAQYQTIKRDLPGSRVIICGCGSEFTSNNEWQNHCVANIEEYGPFIDCAGAYIVEERPGETVYDYVEVSPAYDSEEVVGYKCSICGQQR